MRALRTIAILTVTTLSAYPVIGRAADGGSPAPYSVQGASATVQAEAFRDVPVGSPAYKAIQTLEADGLIKGYPDGTFKGQRPLTRYEAAIITERVVGEVETKLQQQQAVETKDMAALRTLLDSFKTDIDTLKKRVDQLDTRVTAVESDTATLKTTQDKEVKEQDALQASQDKQKLGLLYFLRAPGTFNDRVSGYTATGAALPSGTTLVTNTKLGSGFNTSQNTLQTGQSSAGAGYQVARVFFDGNLDSKYSYHFRLENRYYFANASNNGSSNGSAGTSSTAPNYCSGSAGASITTCGNNYPTNAALRLNYANVQYKDPSGFTATIGRYSEQNSGLGLNYSDYFNGFRVGYVASNWNLNGGYSFDFPALSNGSSCGTATASPSCSGSGQTLFASGGYNFNKYVSTQLSYATDINPQLTLYNPSALIAGAPVTGLYQAANVPIAVGSVFASYNPPFPARFSIEGLHRFGNDPFTKSAWTGSDALWAQVQYGATKANPFRAYVEGGYISEGFNSTSGHTNVISTTGYEQFYLGNGNGYNIAYAAFHYWVSPNVRVGLGFVGYDLLPNSQISASSTTCPGCYITHDIGRAIFLQTFLQF